MTSHIFRFLAFLVITVSCIGAVEVGYSVLECCFLFRLPAEETIVTRTLSNGEKEGLAPAVSRQDINTILTRNLFGTYVKAGTLAVPVVDVAQNPGKRDLEIVLVGTIGGSEGTHRAIIFDKKTNIQKLYKEGDEVNGANIKEILYGKVTLDVKGGEEVLEMKAEMVGSVAPSVTKREIVQEMEVEVEPQSETTPENVVPEEAIPPEVLAAEEAAPEEAIPPEVLAPGEVVPEEDVHEVAPDISPETSPEST